MPKRKKYTISMLREYMLHEMGVCKSQNFHIEDMEFEVDMILKSRGIDRVDIITDPDREVDRHFYDDLAEMAYQRGMGHALQRVVGEWEFYGMPIKIEDNVYVPSPDTETLVDVALEFLNGRDADKRRTIDLCTGSGCIGIALAKYADANVVGIDGYYSSILAACKNIKLNHVDMLTYVADVFDINIPFAGFDLLVCNPPYLTAEDMDNIPKDMREEPKHALFGGADGLTFYRGLIPMYKIKMYNGGMMAFEIGKGQEDAVCEIFRKNGMEPMTRKDLSGIVRVVYAICTDN